MTKSLGLYIHIPFCIRKCNYCDFCSFPGSGENRMIAYTDELRRRMAKAAEKCLSYTVDTVYFGGGTPTLLPLSCWETLMRCIRKNYTVSTDCEITCECNPATADRAYFSTLRRLGVNRLSMGLQSAHDHELSLLGRAHGFADFRVCFQDAREAGFDNVSVDLMYGIPDQTVTSFEKTLQEVVALSPEHISAYGLKIEDGTPFARNQSSLSLPDEDTEWELYRLCSRLLARHGYRKYEISNFAKKGYHSRHNLRYWQRKDYLGFGVAAHSCFKGERFGNSRDLGAFLAGESIEEERVTLSHWDELYEYLILGFRLADGIEEGAFVSRFGMTFAEYYPKTEELIRQGFLQRRDGHIAFTDRGFFVSNAILSDLPEPDAKNG